MKHRSYIYCCKNNNEPRRIMTPAINKNRLWVTPCIKKLSIENDRDFCEKDSRHWIIKTSYLYFWGKVIFTLILFWYPKHLLYIMLYLLIMNGIIFFKQLKNRVPNYIDWSNKLKKILSKNVDKVKRMSFTCTCSSHFGFYSLRIHSFNCYCMFKVNTVHLYLWSPCKYGPKISVLFTTEFKGRMCGQQIKH